MGNERQVPPSLHCFQAVCFAHSARGARIPAPPSPSSVPLLECRLPSRGTHAQSFLVSLLQPAAAPRFRQTWSSSSHAPATSLTRTWTPNTWPILTSIGINKKVYKPSLSEIKDMYYQMFRGKGVDCGAASSTSSAAGPSTPVSSSAIRSSGAGRNPLKEARTLLLWAVV